MRERTIGKREEVRRVPVRREIGMKIHQESLEFALQCAISVQLKWEQEQGYTGESALLATLKSAEDAVRAGENLELFPDTKKYYPPRYDRCLPTTSQAVA